jgi:RNA polymerase sigma factor (sigma-70 family)
VDESQPGSLDRTEGCSAVSDEYRNAAAIDSLYDHKETLKGLLKWCLFHLGDGAAIEDAEEVLDDFRVSDRGKVAATYKPGGAQSLVTYFKLCLKRYCWKRGKRLRTHRLPEESLDQALRNGRQFADENPNANPLQQMLRELDERDRNKEKISRLYAEIEQLPPDDREILRLRYAEGVSLKKVAVQLGIGDSAAKARMRRLKKRLKFLLERNE